MTLSKDPVVGIDDDFLQTRVLPDLDILAQDAFLDDRPRIDQGIPGKHGTVDDSAQYPAPFRAKGTYDGAGMSAHGVGVGRRVRERHGPDRPLGVVEGHGRVVLAQVHVGIPVGLDGAHVLPVRAVLAGQRVGGEVIGEDAAFLWSPGKMSLPKSWLLLSSWASSMTALPSLLAEYVLPIETKVNPLPGPGDPGASRRNRRPARAVGMDAAELPRLGTGTTLAATVTSAPLVCGPASAPRPSCRYGRRRR